jgi:hypothetical protein
VLDSTLQIASKFIGVPLYYNTFSDHRIRIYPKELIFSRTSGYLKYVVTEFEDSLLTFEGFYNMLIAFFKHHEGLSAELKSLYKKHTNQFDILTSFFNYNKGTVDLNYNYIYFSLLKTEIESCILNGYTTSFMVELDQKSSCAVILALLSKNQKLANYSNCIGNKNDIYAFVTDEFIKWLKEYSKSFEGVDFSKLYELIVKEKNFIKKTFMT